MAKHRGTTSPFEATLRSAPQDEVYLNGDANTAAETKIPAFAGVFRYRHSSVALMALPPKIAPPERFCLWHGVKRRS